MIRDGMAMVYFESWVYRREPDWLLRCGCKTLINYWAAFVILHTPDRPLVVDKGTTVPRWGMPTMHSGNAMTLIFINRRGQRDGAKAK
jgi:hypothetical protein